MKEILGKREQFKPHEKVFKYRQSSKHTNFLSQYVFPSVSHYPKGFNTKDERDANQKKVQTCPVTGLPAKYLDPLTGTPYANKEAFRVIREKFLQKDEEKLFLRMQVMSDLLQSKKDQLARKVRKM